MLKTCLNLLFGGARIYEKVLNCVPLYGNIMGKDWILLVFEEASSENITAFGVTSSHRGRARQPSLAQAPPFWHLGRFEK